PSIGAVIEARLATGRLEVRAGRVCGAEVRERGIVVEQRLRGATAPRREHYDWIVNCTGHDRPGAGRALEERLSWRGLLLPDLDGLGWIAGPGGALERSDGSPRRLYLLGPGRRPASFESTAVPELRRQAAALAAELVEVAAARRRGPARGAEPFRAGQPPGSSVRGPCPPSARGRPPGIPPGRSPGAGRRRARRRPSCRAGSGNARAGIRARSRGCTRARGRGSRAGR